MEDPEGSHIRSIVEMEDPEDSHSRSNLPKICAVELPGQVVDTEEAVASIGGAEAVQQAMQRRSGSLSLRLCRQYQYQAPLPMERYRGSDLLVRAKRLSSGAWECQPVGIVQTSFKAKVLADFLFTPGAEMGFGASPVRGSIEKELLDAHPNGPPFMPPPFFTRVNTPQAYNFEGNPFIRRTGKQEVKAIPGTGEMKLKRAWIKVHQVKFSNWSPVPTAAPAGADDQLREDEKTVVEALRKLFSERSVWLRAPMLERLREQGLNPSVSTMQKSLLCTAYLCTNGPWRQAYSVLGFDPRLNPEEARSLQVIDFRDKFLKQRRAYFERVQGTVNASRVAAVDCHFRTPPVHASQLYQLIDIEDEIIEEILSTCGCAEEVSESFGWMPAASFKSIRERMSVKAELMHRSRATGPLALAAPDQRLALTAAPAAKREATGSTKRRVEKEVPQASASDTSKRTSSVPAAPAAKQSAMGSKQPCSTKRCSEAVPASPAAKMAAAVSKKRREEKTAPEESTLEAPERISAQPTAPAATKTAARSKKRSVEKADPKESTVEAAKRMSALPTAPAATKAAARSKKRSVEKADPKESTAEAPKRISALPAAPPAKKAAAGSKKRRVENTGPEESPVEAPGRISALPAVPAAKKAAARSKKRRVEETDPLESHVEAPGRISALPAASPAKKPAERSKKLSIEQTESQATHSGKSSTEKGEVSEATGTRRLRRLRRVAGFTEED